MEFQALQFPSIPPTNCQDTSYPKRALPTIIPDRDMLDNISVWLTMSKAFLWFDFDLGSVTFIKFHRVSI